ncbi:toxin-activating lysine-acyltransferase [Vibrio sp. 10N.261.45.A4]|uniref:toxin-activating lysine-acyltransferase n=2 Tax=Vibrionaceae TaxID=641 RepID=UPI00107F0B94
MKTLSQLNKTISKNTPYIHVGDDMNWVIGAFIELCSRSDQYYDIDIKSFLHWVKPAILHGQYKLIYTEDGVVKTGFILWAWVDNDTLIRYHTSNRFYLHPTEWNEGQNLIIIDYLDLHYSKKNIRDMYRLFKSIKSYVDSCSYCIRDISNKPIKNGYL